MLGAAQQANSDVNGELFNTQIVEDGTGLYLYAGGRDCYSTSNCLAPYGVASSWKISSAGAPVYLSGPLDTGVPGTAEAIAVAPKQGD
jgi:hypothetical protein